MPSTNKEEKYITLYLTSSNILTLRHFQEKFQNKKEDYKIVLEDNEENRRFIMLLTRICLGEEVIVNIGF